MQGARGAEGKSGAQATMPDFRDPTATRSL